MSLNEESGHKRRALTITRYTTVKIMGGKTAGEDKNRRLRLHCILRSEYQVVKKDLLYLCFVKFIDKR